MRHHRLLLKPSYLNTLESSAGAGPGKAQEWGEKPRAQAWVEEPARGAGPAGPAHLRVREHADSGLRLPQLVVDVDERLDRGRGRRLELQLLRAVNPGGRVKGLWI